MSSAGKFCNGAGTQSSRELRKPFGPVCRLRTVGPVLSRHRIGQLGLGTRVRLRNSTSYSLAKILRAKITPAPHNWLSRSCGETRCSYPSTSLWPGAAAMCFQRALYSATAADQKARSAASKPTMPAFKQQAKATSIPATRSAAYVNADVRGSLRERNEAKVQKPMKATRINETVVMFMRFPLF